MATRPCPCGHHGSTLRECRCRPEVIARYQGRLSGPLLDRIDLQVEVPAVPPAVLSSAPDGETSAEVSERVHRARGRALTRQGCPNAHLAGTALDQHAAPTSAAIKLLETAASRLQWSARSYHRVLRVALTIADLAGWEGPGIDVAHVAEAIQYRRSLKVS